MIPVLGIPVLTGPDLLRACVASIDEPLARLVVIDNSPEGGMGDIAREAAPACVGEVIDTRPPDNLGYSASLNLLVRTHAALPWWMYANVDAVFAPGDMARVAQQMEGRDAPFLCGIRDFRLFGLNAAMVETVGFWDENFHPMYCEDTDYTRRMRLADAAHLMLPGETGHVGSATIGDPRYGTHNTRTYPDNRAYYQAKWGGDINAEGFATPFNKGGSVRDWTLSLSRIRDNSWTPRDQGDRPG